MPEHGIRGLGQQFKMMVFASILLILCMVCVVYSQNSYLTVFPTTKEQNIVSFTALLVCQDKSLLSGETDSLSQDSIRINPEKRQQLNYIDSMCQLNDVLQIDFTQQSNNATQPVSRPSHILYSLTNPTTEQIYIWNESLPMMQAKSIFSKPSVENQSTNVNSTQDADNDNSNTVEYRYYAKISQFLPDETNLLLLSAQLVFDGPLSEAGRQFIHISYFNEGSHSPKRQYSQISLQKPFIFHGALFNSSTLSAPLATSTLVAPASPVYSSFKTYALATPTHPTQSSQKSLSQLVLSIPYSALVSSNRIAAAQLTIDGQFSLQRLIPQNNRSTQVSSRLVSDEDNTSASIACQINQRIFTFENHGLQLRQISGQPLDSVNKLTANDSISLFVLFSDQDIQHFKQEYSEQRPEVHLRCHLPTTPSDGSFQNLHFSGPSSSPDLTFHHALPTYVQLSLWQSVASNAGGEQTGEFNHQDTHRIMSFVPMTLPVYSATNVPSITPITSWIDPTTQYCTFQINYGSLDSIDENDDAIDLALKFRLAVEGFKPTSSFAFLSLVDADLLLTQQQQDQQLRQLYSSPSVLTSRIWFRTNKQHTVTTTWSLKKALQLAKQQQQQAGVTTSDRDFVLALTMAQPVTGFNINGPFVCQLDLIQPVDVTTTSIQHQQQQQQQQIKQLRLFGLAAPSQSSTTNSTTILPRHNSAAHTTLSAAHMYTQSNADDDGIASIVQKDVTVSTTTLGVKVTSLPFVQSSTYLPSLGSYPQIDLSLKSLVDQNIPNQKFQAMTFAFRIPEISSNVHQDKNEITQLSLSFGQSDLAFYGDLTSCYVSHRHSTKNAVSPSIVAEVMFSTVAQPNAASLYKTLHLVHPSNNNNTSSLTPFSLSTHSPLVIWCSSLWIVPTTYWTSNYTQKSFPKHSNMYYMLQVTASTSNDTSSQHVTEQQNMPTTAVSAQVPSFGTTVNFQIPSRSQHGDKVYIAIVLILSFSTIALSRLLLQWIHPLIPPEQQELLRQQLEESERHRHGDGGRGDEQADCSPRDALDGEDVRPSSRHSSALARPEQGRAASALSLPQPSQQQQHSRRHMSTTDSSSSAAPSFGTNDLYQELENMDRLVLEDFEDHEDSSGLYGRS